LFRAISNAYSKQRIHVFTTLHPFVDKIDCANQHQLTLAGVLNFIKRAHRNMSLAHTFLHHVERAKILIYVIDISGPSPFDILKTLQQELKTYKSGLIKIQSLTVLIRLQLNKS
jgi:GTP-binding protein